MITGFKPVYYGQKEPRNRNVLWLKPTDDHKSAEIYFYGNSGWMLCGDWELLSSCVSDVQYDSSTSVLSYYNAYGDLLLSTTLSNLNETIAASVTSVKYNSDDLLVYFYNAAGETLFTVDTTGIYTAGNGINITDNVFSVALDPGTESYLTLSATGLKLAGIDDLAARLTTAESDIDNLESGSEELEKRVTTAETDIDSLEERMTTAEADIDSLEARMDTAESDIDNLEERMTTAETDIDNLETRMDTAETDIDNLETRMDTAETDIDNLEETTTSKLVAYGKYDQDTHYINLYASDGTLLSQVDAADFIVDGMLESASLVVNPTGYDEGSYLYFVFNTDAGKEPIYVNVTSLIDIYTGGDGINVSSDNIISLDETYLASLLETYVKYESDYDSGLTIGHLDVNNVSTDVIVPLASTTVYGVVQIGNGINVEDGLITADVDYINNQSSGVTIGTLSVGTVSTSVSVQYATSSQYGVSVASTGLTASEEGEYSVDTDYINELIAENEYILALIKATRGELAGKLTYDSDETTLNLYSNDGTLLSSVDATAFIVDGMLDSVELSDTNADGEEGPYLHFVFNTDAGKTDIYVDLVEFLNLYQAGNGISIDGYDISLLLDPDTESYLSLSESGLKLAGIDDLATRLSAAETDIDNLESRMSLAETAISTNTNNITTNATNISTLYTLVTNLSSTVSELNSDLLSEYGVRMAYDSSSATITLYAKDGTALSTIDASSFIVDGMIESVSKTTTDEDGNEGSYLHFVFNTDAGKEDIYVDVSDMMTVYTAGDGINISDDDEISTDDEYIASLNTLMTEDELDTMILVIEASTKYGMAEAMGII